MMRHHRRSTRLPAFDYASTGAYFVTVCCKERECLFGDVVDGETLHSEAGRIATACWSEIPRHFPGVVLDAFVVMPNHVHGVIVLTHRARNECRGVQLNAPTSGTTDGTADGIAAPVAGPASISPTDGLPVIVRTFKAAVTTACRRAGLANDVWQRGYYDHVVRGDDDLDRIRRYIEENPARWASDEDNPSICRGVPLNAPTFH
jgi:REP element-mobilizing transposase RayT